MKRILALAVGCLGLFSCEQVKFSNPDGTRNQAWNSPAGFERQGMGSPFGAGMFPGSR